MLLTPNPILIGWEWLTEMHCVKSGQSILNMAIIILDSASQMKQFIFIKS